MKPCGCGGTQLFRACGDGGVLPQGWAGRNQAIVLSAIECPLSTYCGHCASAPEPLVVPKVESVVDRDPARRSIVLPRRIALVLV